LPGTWKLINVITNKILYYDVTLRRVRATIVAVVKQ